MLGPNAFQEVVRTVSVSYPIPFIFALSVTAGLILLGLNAVVPDIWLKGLGAICILSGLFIAGYATIWRPALLRSERHTLALRAMEIMLDRDVDREARSHVLKIVDGTLIAGDEDRKSSKKELTAPEADDTEDGDA